MEIRSESSKKRSGDDIHVDDTKRKPEENRSRKLGTSNQSSFAFSNQITEACLPPVIFASDSSNEVISNEFGHPNGSDASAADTLDGTTASNAVRHIENDCINPWMADNLRHAVELPSMFSSPENSETWRRTGRVPRINSAVGAHYGSKHAG